MPAGYGGYRRVSQALRAKPAEPDLTSPAWVESAEVILDIIEDSTKDAVPACEVASPKLTLFSGFVECQCPM